MSIWIQQKIKFIGKDDKELDVFIKRFESNIYDKIDSKEYLNYFDFNKIIPMPDELDINNNEMAIVYYASDRCKLPINKISNNKYCVYVDGQSVLFSAAYYYNLLLTSQFSNEEYDKLYKDGKNLCNNIDKYLYAYWYPWCKKNWGCKFNSSNVKKEENIISFETPNSLPLGIYSKLSKLCEENNIGFIMFYSSDEDNDIKGRITGGIFRDEHDIYHFNNKTYKNKEASMMNDGRKRYELLISTGENDQQIVFADLTNLEVSVINQDISGKVSGQFIIILTDGSEIEIGIIDKITLCTTCN